MQYIDRAHAVPCSEALLSTTSPARMFSTKAHIHVDPRGCSLVPGDREEIRSQGIQKVYNLGKATHKKTREPINNVQKRRSTSRRTKNKREGCGNQKTRLRIHYCKSSTWKMWTDWYCTKTQRESFSLVFIGHRGRRSEVFDKLNVGNDFSAFENRGLFEDVGLFE